MTASFLGFKIGTSELDYQTATVLSNVHPKSLQPRHNSMNALHTSLIYIILIQIFTSLESLLLRSNNRNCPDEPMNNTYYCISSAVFPGSCTFMSLSHMQSIFNTFFLKTFLQKKSIFHTYFFFGEPIETVRRHARLNMATQFCFRTDDPESKIRLRVCSSCKAVAYCSVSQRNSTAPRSYISLLISALKIAL